MSYYRIYCGGLYIIDATERNYALDKSASLILIELLVNL